MSSHLVIASFGFPIWLVVYTSLDDEVPASSWLALPGGKNRGIRRHWHFFSIIFWVLNGVIYIVLLFATGEWTRLSPPRARSITVFKAGRALASGQGYASRKSSNACQPLPEARYLVFTSYGLDEHSLDGKNSCPFYEVIDFELAKHPQTILAYALNDEPVPIPHGAPLRLRIETVLGYKMVKYLRSIELVTHYDTLGAGQGGSREDTVYYGKGAEI